MQQAPSEPETTVPLPPTSLIVCSRNRPTILSNLVESVLGGEEVPTELIIVDDSDERNEHLAALVTSRCAVRYIWNRSRGLSRANNTGIALAAHDLLVFTQDDVLVEQTWFGTLVRALLHAGPRTVVTGQVLPGHPENETGFAPSTVADGESRVFVGRIARDVLYFQNAAFHRSVVEDVGWFDPNIGPGTRFPTAEDNDFGFRVLEAGYQILYEPRAVTRHRAWRTGGDYFHLEWTYGRGQGAFYGKHLSLRDPFILKRFLRDMTAHVVRWPVRLFVDRRRLGGSAAFVAGVLTAVGEWLVRRPQIEPASMVHPRSAGRSVEASPPASTSGAELPRS